MASQIDAGDRRISQRSFQPGGDEKVAGVEFALDRLLEQLHEEPLKEAPIFPPEGANRSRRRGLVFADRTEQLVMIAAFGDIFRGVHSGRVSVSEQTQKHLRPELRMFLFES